MSIHLSRRPNKLGQAKDWKANMQTVSLSDPRRCKHSTAVSGTTPSGCTQRAPTGPTIKTNLRPLPMTPHIATQSDAPSSLDRPARRHTTGRVFIATQSDAPSSLDRPARRRTTGRVFIATQSDAPSSLDRPARRRTTGRVFVTR
jgi:hypothetical protein